jgi:hypothetical protein
MFIVSCKSTNIVDDAQSYRLFYLSKVEATDDDCGTSDHRVCNYRIITPNVPFTIDSNGSITIRTTLVDDQYEFDVIAIDCYPSSSMNNPMESISEPAHVIVKRIQSCKPMITGRNHRNEQ